MLRFAMSLLVMLTMALPAHAVQPDEVLDDPVLEERAREISKEIRCLVCRNESRNDIGNASAGQVVSFQRGRGNIRIGQTGLDRHNLAGNDDAGTYLAKGHSNQIR